MRRIFLAFALALAAFAAADKPFPDTKANHWVYEAMIQIKKDKLWYRAKDNIPKKKKLTRADMATKTLYLALDSQQLIQGFRRTTEMYRKRPSNAATQNWQRRFAAGFPKKKLMYQNYLVRVTKLWNYFQPEIKVLAKAHKVDPKLITQNLKLEKLTLDAIRLPAKTGG